MASKYTMRISRLTVDKLGVKLYDRVSAVIAELIANSYDADAKRVEIEAPMGELLATKIGGNLKDKGFQIVVRDYGIGMTPDETNEFFLTVGRERRKDPKRGDTSRELGRKVMGRKGVGKLAPFGICSTIEVISAGGPKVAGRDHKGRPAKGYLTAHLLLEKDKILKDTDEDYHPAAGSTDGSLRPERGTTLILRDFEHRRVPDLDDFARQLSHRFGIEAADWKIVLVDTTKTDTDPARERVVGSFDVETMDGTLLRFEAVPGRKAAGTPTRTIGSDGKPRSDIPAGITLEGRFYPLTGWVAYSKHPYKDDLMAGVRIYCRGKIASQTNIFNRRAGFTGEHGIRSYLVGELHADWLDTEEDLIQTDRRDILWSHELGHEFEEWGQNLVVQLGRMSRNPLKQRTWDLFQQVSKIDERIDKAFPSDDQKEIRQEARALGKLIAQNIRHDEIEDKEHVESVVQLTLNLAPHVTLNEKLREAVTAAEAAGSPLAAVTALLKTARIAELSAFGMIADERVRVIGKVEQLKDDKDTLEAAFQDLITQAPWLIDPQWSPIVSNQSFATLKSEFQKVYKKRTGNDLTLNPFPKEGKRADFVMAVQEGIIQLIEIKKPNYKLNSKDLDRINTYVELMTDFMALETHKDFRAAFRDFHVTLVCDEISLTGVHKTAFEGLKANGRMTHINWRAFLLRTRKMHEDFLREAERQKKHAAKTP